MKVEQTKLNVAHLKYISEHTIFSFYFDEMKRK